jgi:membrane fusion protein, copper/silver efflux system
MKKYLIIVLLAILGLACENKKIAKDADVFYTCSMDPQVVSSRPGNCPICGMPLTLVKKSSVQNTDEIQLSDQQIQLGNIIVDTIQKANIAREIEFTGTLNLNASQMTSVSARVMGRIEKLFVKTTGDYVAKGTPLFELYSEELNNAKQEYIAALQRRSLFKDQTLIDFESLLESSRAKLRLWGMTEAQIKTLEGSKQAPLTTTFYSNESGYVTSLDVTEGGYVMEGGTIMQLANLSTLWAEAQVYTTQLYQIPKGAMATILIPGIDKKLTGRIEFANPEVAAETRINLLRVVVPNKSNELKPGMSVIISVQTANRNSLALPADAVIRDANGATVWIQSGKNKFKSKMVTTGIENDRMVEIITGLKEGDAVVTMGTYLLHSEFVFKRGADPMSSHNH